MEKIELEKSALNLDFLEEGPVQPIPSKGCYKILIADDDAEIHTVTKMILRSFSFEGKSLAFIDTYSGKETMDALELHPDTAVLFLDVVMEQNNAGLMVVEYLRNTLKNSLTRIILRTGQPGEAPEDRIIRDYDINDYRLKTELTVQRLNTSLYAALRSYRDIMKLERNRRGLEKMIEASSEMFKHNSLTDFLNSMLSQISSFYQDDMDMIYLRESDRNIQNGFIATDTDKRFVIIAAKGKYEEYIGKNIYEIDTLESIQRYLENEEFTASRVCSVEDGFIVKRAGKNHVNNYIFVEGDKEQYNLDLLNLFLANYAIAMDNYYLDKITYETQVEIIYTLGEVIETQFEETSGHLKRVTNYMYLLAKKAGISDYEAEFLRISSALHDVGKIGIPESILTKPGKLTPDEMEVMRKHAQIGNRILEKSKLDIFRIAAEIALHHHERYDGTGYPEGLREKEISIYSRMMAIVDVFDAMTHKRVYKDACGIDETLQYIMEQKGKHFDPELVDLFIEHLDEIIDNQENEE